LNSGANHYVYMDEDYGLAHDCVRQLGCGEELIGLINAVMLQDKGIGGVFDKFVREMLAGRAGVSQRASLAQITSDPKIRERWSYFAGAGCTPAELDALCNVLANDADRNAARLGSCIKLAEADPASGLKSAAQELVATGGKIKGEVFKDIVESARDIALYGSIESQLRSVRELDTGHDKYVQTAREQLLRQWTDANASNMIGYFNSQAAEMGPQDAAFVLSRIVSFKGSAAAFALVQDLQHPEHFDRAAFTVIQSSSAKYPKESLELAHQIKSETDREHALEWISKVQASLMKDGVTPNGNNP
jgi:hypothetical protein